MNMDLKKQMKDYIKSVLESKKEIKNLAKKGVINYNPKNNSEKTKGAIVIRNEHVNSIAAFLEDNNNEAITIVMIPNGERVLITTSSGVFSAHNMNLNGVCISKQTAKANTTNICKDCKSTIEGKQNKGFIEQIKERINISKRFIIGKSNSKAIEHIFKVALEQIQDLIKMEEDLDKKAEIEVGPIKPPIATGEKKDQILGTENER